MNNNKFFPSSIKGVSAVLLLHILLIYTFKKIIYLDKITPFSKIFFLLLLQIIVLVILHLINLKNKTSNYNFTKISINLLFSSTLFYSVIYLGIIVPVLLIAKSSFINEFTPIIFNSVLLFKIVFSLIIKSIYEEIIFRHYILKGLTFSLSENRAIIISSLLYMIFGYFLNKFDLFSIIYDLFLGLFLGWIFVKSKYNLSLIIILRIVTNFAIFASPYKFFSNTNNLILIVVLVVSLLLLYPLFRMVKKHLKYSE